MRSCIFCYLPNPLPPQQKTIDTRLPTGKTSFMNGNFVVLFGALSRQGCPLLENMCIFGTKNSLERAREIPRDAKLMLDKTHMNGKHCNKFGVQSINYHSV